MAIHNKEGQAVENEKTKASQRSADSESTHPPRARNGVRERARGGPAENAIRPTTRRVASVSISAPLGPAAETDKSQAGRSNAAAQAQRATSAPHHPVPEEIRRQFVQVGRKYYFPDGARAFTDRGDRLTTPSENTEVIRSLVAIAQARSWSHITVTGTERFRKEAWFAARLADLEVRGYRPTEFEQERLARAAARRSRPDPEGPVRPADAAAAEPKPSRGERQGRGTILSGRLIDHGSATYRHDPHEPMSYFAKIETARGERTLWGVDLERAFKESLTKPEIGDEVGLRALRKDVVTVKAPERDANGRIIGEKELQTYRNRWIVEKRDFFEAREAAAQTVRNTAVRPREAVRQHPELAGTYLYLKGAEEIARRRIRDPEDQRRFVDTVRGALAESVARGEPLAAVRLRERARNPEREQAPARG